MTLKRIGTLVFFRIALFASIFLLSLLVLLSLAAIQIGKQVDVQAQFFTVFAQPREKDYKSGERVKISPDRIDSATLKQFSQLNTLSPMSLRTKDKQLIDEMLLRYYLEMRYTQIPDVNEMSYRWGIGSPIYLLSTPKLYKEFAGNLKEKIENLPNKITTIEIEKVDREDNSFKVDFIIHENLSDGQVRSKAKQVRMEFRYISARARRSPIFSNPYGLVFTSFEEAERKLSSN